MNAPRVGQMVNPNLRLLRPLGAGGMGSVWVARHLGLDTNVVVKFISAELVEHPRALERLRRETAVAGSDRKCRTRTRACPDPLAASAEGS